MSSPDASGTIYIVRVSDDYHGIRELIPAMSREAALEAAREHLPAIETLVDLPHPETEDDMLAHLEETGSAIWYLEDAHASHVSIALVEKELQREPIDPLDLTLRQIAGLAGDSDHEHAQPHPDELAFDGPPQVAISRAFENIHPAVAGVIVRRIAEGIDNGYTAQGASHRDFQHGLEVARDE